MKTTKLLLLMAGGMLVFLVLVAGLTNLDDLKLLGYLNVTDSVRVVGNLGVTGNSVTDGLASFDSSLYLGATTYYNGGVYRKVVNKSGQILSVGRIAAWDGTLVGLGWVIGSSGAYRSLVTIASEGGAMQLVFSYVGTAPSTDSVIIWGQTIDGVNRDTVNADGTNDTTYSKRFFTTVDSTTKKGALTPDSFRVWGTPLYGVIRGGKDSSMVLAGVVYPSTIADNAVGWIIVQGAAKLLYTGATDVMPGYPLIPWIGQAGVAKKLDFGATTAFVDSSDTPSWVIGYAMMWVNDVDTLYPHEAYIDIR